MCQVLKINCCPLDLQKNGWNCFKKGENAFPVEAFKGETAVRREKGNSDHSSRCFIIFLAVKNKIKQLKVSDMFHFFGHESSRIETSKELNDREIIIFKIKQVPNCCDYEHDENFYRPVFSKVMVVRKI